MIEVNINEFEVFEIRCENCGTPIKFYHYLPLSCTICQSSITNVVALIFGPAKHKLDYHRFGKVDKESRRVPV